MRLSRWVLPLLLIASGCATQPTAPVESDHWHVLAVPQGGQNASASQAILLNSKTGETWVYFGGDSRWTQMQKQ
jgi:hypothetical protein